MKYTLDAARIAQGVKSQAQLDAAAAVWEHKAACPVCSRIGGTMPLDDGQQPYMDECKEGERLTLEAWRA